MPAEYFNDRNGIYRADPNIKVYSNIRIMTIDINIVGPGSEYIPHVKTVKFSKMNKTHAPTNTKNRKSENSHICNYKNDGNSRMMVANTKMELSELTGITKNRILMVERKVEPTKHSIEQSKVNQNFENDCRKF